MSNVLSMTDLLLTPELVTSIAQFKQWKMKDDGGLMPMGNFEVEKEDYDCIDISVDWEEELYVSIEFYKKEKQQWSDGGKSFHLELIQSFWTDIKTFGRLDALYYGFTGKHLIITS